jgi:hypothetical protein
MSSGLYFVLGMAVGAALTAVLFMSTRGRAPTPAPREQVSEETLARARELVAAGKIVHAVKVIRDETGWDLKHSKAVVDAMPRTKKNDGFGY